MEFERYIPELKKYDTILFLHQPMTSGQPLKIVQRHMAHPVNQQFHKCKNLNNVPFLCTKLFQKRGHYSKGDIIQGGTLFKEIR